MNIVKLKCTDFTTDWYRDKEIEIEPQELKSPERAGFTVIEWGGSEISKWEEF